MFAWVLPTLDKWRKLSRDLCAVTWDEYGGLWEEKIGVHEESPKISHSQDVDQKFLGKKRAIFGLRKLVTEIVK